GWDKLLPNPIPDESFQEAWTYRLQGQPRDHSKSKTAGASDACGRVGFSVERLLITTRSIDSASSTPSSIARGFVLFASRPFVDPRFVHFSHFVFNYAQTSLLIRGKLLTAL